MTINYKELRQLRMENDDVGSILEDLYNQWIDNDPVCDDEVRGIYRELEACVSGLTVAESDRISNLIADLCVAYSRGAFLDGIRTGGRLILEILG